MFCCAARQRPALPLLALRRPRPGRVAAIVLATALTGAVCQWRSLRRRHTFAGYELASRRPSQLFTDRYGTVIRAELGDHDCWYIPVPLEAMSKDLIAASIAVEDRRFWDHGGIDWVAVCRAFLSNVTSGRIVSGASTISMQLARLASPERRSYPAKMRQALRALDLEERHSKRWILEHYLNHAPYGANLIGVEAAARAYFGKSAAELSLFEATLMAGLPQRPSVFRLDRGMALARRRQRTVLTSLCRMGYIDQQTMQELAERPSPALPTTPAPAHYSKIRTPATESQYCRLATRECTAETVTTALEPSLQDLGLHALCAQLETLPNVEDGALVIIENATGAVRALVGTVDFHAQPHGETNAACARRSPGSALKPFIYLLALDGGIIAPDTTLSDRPLSGGTYRPANYDAMFRTNATARLALSQSLNTPAVRLLGQIGPAYLLDQAAACGITSLDRGADTYGLALALGGGEVTLLELTNAYAGLARGGVFRPCTFLERSTADTKPTQPFARGAVSLLVDMLSTNRLPGCTGLDVAWKTGTSNGHRDAWCIAFNSEFTVGVWLGNKSGRAARGLVGIAAAGPVVADVLQGIYRARPAPPALERGAGVVETTLCRASGLKALPHCTDTFAGCAVDGVPLRNCALHRVPAWPATVADRTPANPPPDADAATPEQRTARILSPAPGVYRAAPDGLRLRIHASNPGNNAWFIDGECVGQHTDPFWHRFERGTHRIACVPASHRPATPVLITVR